MPERNARRRFLAGAGLLSGGLAAGAWLGWRGRELTAPPYFRGRSRETPSADGMPGPFPGRVVEVLHPGAVDADHAIQAGPVAQMMARGICSLVGANDVAEAWRRFFSRDDVVGVKVNPVGRRPRPGEAGRVAGAVGSISSPAVLVETVRALREYVGLPPQNIIVFERYANEFREAGYERLMSSRPLDGCRWLASSSGYDDSQLRIDGQSDAGRDANVVGYDPDVFADMGFCDPRHHPRDDRRTRSHLSMIVTRMCNKIITIPCLKDHRSAGVTLALKNMSHGMNNNVARSHVSGVYRIGGTVSGPNQCNTFIPTAVNQAPLRAKATLHILDGLIGVYEGGPGSWNRTWGTWSQRSLYFATDPVALDHVGWDAIDRKRAELGWAPVARMGQLHGAPSVTWPPAGVVASLATPYAAASAALVQARTEALASGRAEQFDRRQPEHVALAGLVGLGWFEPHRIDHHRVRLAG